MVVFKNSPKREVKKKRGKYQTLSVNAHLVGQALTPLLTTLGYIKDGEVIDCTIDGKVAVELEFKVNKD